MPASSSSSSPARASGWTFLSNHAHVLTCLARDPDARLRDIAELVGITERRVATIVAELEHAGVIERVRVGRRNHYTIDGGARLRHTLEAHCTVASLLAIVADEGTG